MLAFNHSWISKIYLNNCFSVSETNWIHSLLGHLSEEGISCPYNCSYVLFICSMILGDVSFPCFIKDLWVVVGFSFLKCLELKLQSLMWRAKENVWKSQPQYTKLPLLPHHHHKYMGDWRKHGMLALFLISSLSDSIQWSYSSPIHKAGTVYSQLSQQFFEAHPMLFQVFVLNTKFFSE